MTVLAISAPLAAAANPNVSDDVDEPDPRTDGATTLPDSLDIATGTISPNSATVDFEITVQSLFVPHTQTLVSGFSNSEIRYEFRFDIPSSGAEGNLCGATSTGFVYAETTAGAYRTASSNQMNAVVGCIGSAHFHECSGSFASANRVENTITISTPRDCTPYLDAGTTLENPEIVVYRPENGVVENRVYEPVYGNEATPLDTFDHFDKAGPGSDQTI